MVTLNAVVMERSVPAHLTPDIGGLLRNMSVTQTTPNWSCDPPKVVATNQCMSLSWAERKDILSSLLQARDDDEEGIALDRVLHGQNTIGKTCKCFSYDSVDRSIIPN